MVKIKGKRTEVEAKLKKLAKTNCSKCYGRGFLGFNLNTFKFTICKCLKPKKFKKLSIPVGLDLTKKIELV